MEKIKIGKIVGSGIIGVLVAGLIFSRILGLGLESIFSFLLIVAVIATAIRLIGPYLK